MRLAPEQIRWNISTHEAGHAVCGAAMGIVIGGVSFDADGYGATTHTPGENVHGSDDAIRMATYLWAGMVAEQIVLPCEVRRAAGDCDRGENSDHLKIAFLAGSYGGDHVIECASWSLKCRDKARLILAMNYAALQQTAERIYRGYPVHFTDPPLLFVRRNFR